MLEVTVLGADESEDDTFEKTKKAIEKCFLGEIDNAARAKCIMKIGAAAGCASAAAATGAGTVAAPIAGYMCSQVIEIGAKAIALLGDAIFGTYHWEFVHAAKALEDINWWYWDGREESIRVGEVVIPPNVACRTAWQGHCNSWRVVPALAWLYDDADKLLKVVAIPFEDLAVDGSAYGSWADARMRDPKDGLLKPVSRYGKYVPGLYRVGNPAFPSSLPAFEPVTKSAAQRFRESNLPTFTTEPLKIYEPSITERKKPWYKKPAAVATVASVGALGAYAFFRWGR